MKIELSREELKLVLEGLHSEWIRLDDKRDTEGGKYASTDEEIQRCDALSEKLLEILKSEEGE
jgi:hypothetical protein